METLKLYWNKTRIWFLSVFTNRIKKIQITDKEGKEHNITVEQNVEKVCDHKTIKEIAPTMWQCTRCQDVYFQIGYKVLLNRHEFIGYLEKCADHLKMKLEDEV
jgi:ribosomal protein L37AE/L43A